MLLSVLVTAGILFAVGAQKNAQISDLRHHGVRVEVTVAGCLGLLGGSGSNAAGNACRGTYRYGGRGYDEAIPGTARRAPGSTLTGIVARDDPALLTTPTMLATEHPSSRVYLAPSAFVLADVLLGALLVARHRRPRSVPGVQAGGV